MIIPLKIAEILAETGKKLSELVDDLPTFPKERMNLECGDAVKFEVMHALAERLAIEYGADLINTMDGIRIDFSEEGWVLIRASNTSPLVRVTVEGATEEVKEKLMKTFVSVTKEEITKVI
jgi:phosphomannomutase